MSDSNFDPYHRWLGIPPNEQPADSYRLLGLSRFETDLEVIVDAAERQMGHVRRYQMGEYSESSQRILNELGAAKGVLLDPARKAAYDQELRDRVARIETQNASPNSIEVNPRDSRKEIRRPKKQSPNVSLFADARIMAIGGGVILLLLAIALLLILRRDSGDATTLRLNSVPRRTASETGAREHRSPLDSTQEKLNSAPSEAIANQPAPSRQSDPSRPESDVATKASSSPSGPASAPESASANAASAADASANPAHGGLSPKAKKLLDETTRDAALQEIFANPRFLDGQSTRTIKPPSGRISEVLVCGQPEGPPVVAVLTEYRSAATAGASSQIRNLTLINSDGALILPFLNLSKVRGQIVDIDGDGVLERIEPMALGNKDGFVAFKMGRRPKVLFQVYFADKPGTWRVELRAGSMSNVRDVAFVQKEQGTVRTFRRGPEGDWRRPPEIKSSEALVSIGRPVSVSEFNAFIANAPPAHPVATFVALWKKPPANNATRSRWILKTDISLSELPAMVAANRRSGYVPHCVNGYANPEGELRFVVVWVLNPAANSVLHVDLDNNQSQRAFDGRPTGSFPVWRSMYRVKNRTRGVFVFGPPPAKVAWQTRRLSAVGDFLNEHNSYTRDGYKLISVSRYPMSRNAAGILATWVKPSAPTAFDLELTADEFQERIDGLRGRSPIWVDACELNGKRTYSLVTAASATLDWAVTKSQTVEELMSEAAKRKRLGFYLFVVNSEQ